MMNNSNKKLTLFTSLASSTFSRALAKVRRPEVDTHSSHAMEHLQSTTLLIQSTCFFQLVNKLSLLSTPMSQTARSHTTLALTWTLKHFNWKYVMCHLYIVYYRFMNEYPMFVYSGLPWTTIGNECTQWRRCWTVTKRKHCPQMNIRQAHSGK